LPTLTPADEAPITASQPYISRPSNIGSAPYTQSGLSSPGIPPTIAAPPQTQPALPPAAVAPGPQKRGRGPLYAVLSLALILALLAAGLGLRATLTKSAGGGVATATAVPVLGQLTFVKSASAASGTFDQLRLDLTNIPAPGSGQGYYAWLMTSCTDSENLGPHWALPISANAIHTPRLADPRFKNLFCPGTNSALVISLESTSPPPLVATDRRYYAPIDRASSVSFNVIPCPKNASTCESG
jgi:hypothetical protein